MRKVIDGKLYSTNSAREVDGWCHNRGTYQQYGETLFKKRTGEYFLFREPYFTDQKEIIPLDVTAAQRWMERYGDVDAYAAEWGLPEE